MAPRFQDAAAIPILDCTRKVVVFFFFFFCVQNLFLASNIDVGVLKSTSA
jgi:hypothetical protein